MLALNQFSEDAPLARAAPSGQPENAGTARQRPRLAWWPRYDRTAESLSLRAGGESHSISDAEFVAQHQCAFWDATVAKGRGPAISVVLLTSVRRLPNFRLSKLSGQAISPACRHLHASPTLAPGTGAKPTRPPPQKCWYPAMKGGAS